MDKWLDSVFEPFAIVTYAEEALQRHVEITSNQEGK